MLSSNEHTASRGFRHAGHRSNQGITMVLSCPQLSGHCLQGAVGTAVAPLGADGAGSTRLSHTVPSVPSQRSPHRSQCVVLLDGFGSLRALLPQHFPLLLWARGCIQKVLGSWISHCPPASQPQLGQRSLLITSIISPGQGTARCHSLHRLRRSCFKDRKKLPSAFI